MSIDPSNKDSLRKFFEDHPHMSTYELAMISGRSPSTIRNWKRRCGLSLKNSPFPRNQSYKKREVLFETDQNVWDCEEWFRQKYEIEKLGIPTIARVISRSVSLVANRLKKYDVKTRPHSTAVQSSNRYSNEEWLYYKYATRDQYIDWCMKNSKAPDEEGGCALSLAKCAKLAGVVPYTIYNWLVRFRVPIRDINEAMTGDNNPFYGKKHSEETKEKIRQAYWRKAHDNTEIPPKESTDQKNP